MSDIIQVAKIRHLNIHIKKRRFISEIISSLSSQFNRENFIHYVCGDNNKAILEHFGAKNIRLLSHKDTLTFSSKFNHLYNKALITQIAMEEHNNILFLDWDIIIRKMLDHEFYKAISEKRRLTKGEIKMPVVWYPLPRTPAPLRPIHPPFKNDIKRILLQNSLIYCSNKFYIDNWVKYYEDYPEGNSEDMITYSLKKLYGVMDKEELYEIFDTDCLQTHWGLNDKKKRQPYLTHHLS